MITICEKKLSKIKINFQRTYARALLTFSKESCAEAYGMETIIGCLGLKDKEKVWKKEVEQRLIKCRWCGCEVTSSHVSCPSCKTRDIFDLRF